MTLFDVMSLNFNLIVGFVLWTAFCVILVLLDVRARIKEAFKAGYVTAVSDERDGGFDEEEENNCGVVAFEEWIKR